MDLTGLSVRMSLRLAFWCLLHGSGVLCSGRWEMCFSLFSGPGGTPARPRVVATRSDAVCCQERGLADLCHRADAALPSVPLGSDRCSLGLSPARSAVLQMMSLGTGSLCQECNTSSRLGDLGFAASFSASSSANVSTECQTALLVPGMLVGQQTSSVQPAPGHKRQVLDGKRTLLFSSDAFPCFCSLQQASRPLCYSV